MNFTAFICSIEKCIQLNHSVMDAFKQATVCQITVLGGLQHVPRKSCGDDFNLIDMSWPTAAAQLWLGHLSITATILLEDHSSRKSFLFLLKKGHGKCPEGHLPSVLKVLKIAHLFIC